MLQYFLAILCIFIGFSGAQYTIVSPCESARDILDEFYTSTNGEQWVNREKWNADDEQVCERYGVTCRIDENECSVVGLDLTENQVVGSIPSSIGELTSLETLIMKDNQLDKEIPESIGNLVGLIYLDMSDNQFLSMPDSIGNLSSLQYLNLGTNEIEGTIPDSIGNLDELRYLTLNHNKFFGSIPESIINLTSLTIMELQVNRISGTLPQSIGELINLETLNLHSNQFIGTIYGSIEMLTNLQNLELNGNEFSEIFSDLSLNSSEISFNLRDNNFPCPLPDWCGEFACEPCIKSSSITSSISPTLILISNSISRTPTLTYPVISVSIFVTSSITYSHSVSPSLSIGFTTSFASSSESKSDSISISPTVSFVIQSSSLIPSVTPSSRTMLSVSPTPSIITENVTASQFVKVSVSLISIVPINTASGILSPKPSSSTSSTSLITAKDVSVSPFKSLSQVPSTLTTTSSSPSPIPTPSRTSEISQTPSSTLNSVLEGPIVVGESVTKPTVSPAVEILVTAISSRSVTITSAMDCETCPKGDVVIEIENDIPVESDGLITDLNTNSDGEVVTVGSLEITGPIVSITSEIVVLVSEIDSQNIDGVTLGPIVADITLLDIAGNSISDLGKEELELCLNAGESVSLSDSCLGFFDEDKGKWVCQDYCLQKKYSKDGDTQFCGITDHLTSFAILLDSGGSDGECRQSLDSYIYVWISLGVVLFAVIMIFAVVILYEILFRKRIRRRKRSLRTAVEIISTRQPMTF